ncbi:hypothetical protein [Sphingomonas sp.]|uniref:hypothetical protein n=1 Tax=Sphingomonas sp. TaxID=28214 RepID=UPI00185AA059|nr:hypothetical protein [Sphingomonas sp.]MBA3512120.1 hypothetical protein [Sphingomonas sp.]
MLVSLIVAIAMAASAPSEAEIGGKSSPKALRALHAYGRCVAIERPVAVRALLDSDFRDRAYGKEMRKLVNRPAPCPGVSVPRGAYSSGTLLWGGALAEGLLRRDGSLDDLAARTGYNPALPAIEARNAGELMAFCAVRKDAAAVARLLKTDPATAAEYDAIVALGPVLGGCLPANSKSRFTREALRALLALGANRLAQHNSTAAR